MNAKHEVQSMSSQDAFETFESACRSRQISGLLSTRDAGTLLDDICIDLHCRPQDMPLDFLLHFEVTQGLEIGSINCEVFIKATKKALGLSA